MDTQQNFIFEKSNWGDSIEYTLANYPELVENSEKKHIELGLRMFSKEKYDSIPELRIFTFYNGKLCGIYLYFYELDQVSQEILVNKFIKKYGEPKNRSQNKVMINENIFASNTIYSYSISGELIIWFTVIEHIHKFTDEIRSRGIECHYSNPKIMTKLMMETAKKQTGDIHF